MTLQNELNIQVTQGSSNSWTGIDPQLDLIQIMGWPSLPSVISVNDTTLDANSYDYDIDSKLLTIQQLQLDMNVNWVLVLE